MKLSADSNFPWQKNIETLFEIIVFLSFHLENIFVAVFVSPKNWAILINRKNETFSKLILHCVDLENGWFSVCKKFVTIFGVARFRFSTEMTKSFEEKNLKNPMKVKCNKSWKFSGHPRHVIYDYTILRNQQFFLLVSDC